MNKYNKLFLITTLTLIIACSSSDSEDNSGPVISDVTFTPQTFQDGSELLIQWSSTDIMDQTSIDIIAPGYINNTGSGINFSKISLPANNYSFYFKNSEDQEFGPFDYTYNPMIYDLRSGSDFDTGARGVRFEYRWYSDQANPTRFDIEYGVTGFNQGEGTTKFILNSNFSPNDTQEFFAVENIVPGQIHDFYVRSFYPDTGQSEWAGPLQVEFPSDYLSCTVPNLQSITIINDFFGDPSSAEITFNAEGVNYQVSLVPNSSSDPDDGNIFDLTNTTFAITQIVQNANYYFALRTECFDGSYTDWSEIYMFTVN